MSAKKKIETVIVDFVQFTNPDFIPPGSYYIRNAMGDYIFMKTATRAKAQDYIDEEYGKRYTVIPAKNEKTKSRLESGGLSCTGTSTRRGQRR